MNRFVTVAPTMSRLSASAVKPDSAGISAPTAPAISSTPITYRSHWPTPTLSKIFTIYSVPPSFCRPAVTKESASRA